MRTENGFLRSIFLTFFRYTLVELPLERTPTDIRIIVIVRRAQLLWCVRAQQFGGVRVYANCCILRMCAFFGTLHWLLCRESSTERQITTAPTRNFVSLENACPSLSVRRPALPTDGIQVGWINGMHANVDM